jgi:hypothetical protein
MVSLYKKIFWVAIFSISMAFLESAVVIYLRELYYPEGFSFPLKTLSEKIIVTELFRELATLIMMISVAFMVASNKNDRFSWFIFVFGIWDIFYYVFLKIFLDWPASLLTWDILFLLPSTWVGPIICPIINSLTMIIIAIIVLVPGKNGLKPSIARWEWALLIIGAALVFMAYTEEYYFYISSEFNFGKLLLYSTNDELIKHASQFIPQSFRWDLFISGQLLFIGMMIIYGRRKFTKR